jgi:hypothetical protein
MTMADGNGNPERRHVLFVWSPSGYRVRERSGDPPPVGAELEEDGNELVVTKIGPSPFPGDSRPCAFTTGRR